MATLRKHSVIMDDMAKIKRIQNQLCALHEKYQNHNFMLYDGSFLSNLDCASASLEGILQDWDTIEEGNIEPCEDEDF